MDVLFENTFEMTRTRYLEFCNAPAGLSAKRALRRWKLRGDILIALSALLVVLSALLRDWILTAATSFLTLFCLYNRIFRRTRLNRRQYARIRQAQTTPQWLRTARFGEDAVTVDDANAQTRFTYADFAGLSEERDIFYLWRDADFVLRLPKDCFTVGNVEEFAIFIRQKIEAGHAVQTEKGGNTK